MIYIDSSVALAYLLAEPRSPSTNLWRESLTSRVLLEYEVWNRVNALGRSASLADDVRALLSRTSLIEMDRRALARALEPWPLPLRTLDGLHLATMEFLRQEGHNVELASYDSRLAAAAQAVGIVLAAL
ncbi:MAG TPA: PIN domain-containing protein [Stellaceae bacterium]